MKYLYTLALLGSLMNKGYAQNSKITGSITDTSSHAKLSGAVIYILQAKDSIIIDFARSNNGEFIIEGLPADSIIVLVTYPNFADYSDKLLSDGASTINLNIPLTSKLKLLEAVVVKGKMNAITIKGDTTEYNADSFILPPNASAQDLLKKLPGIQVDRNGKIMARGERVTKVLVDGEEFFSSDPTLVTQSLTAAMVSKVQVYNEKSALAKQTGINDGLSSKTINIKLKEDSKNGYFGKINLGGGTDGYYNQKAFLNFFKGKRKLAFFTNVSNTGTEGFYDDETTFTSNGLTDPNANAGQLDSWQGDYHQQGLPKLAAGGVHFNNSFNEGKNTLSADYKIHQLRISGTDSSAYSYNLADKQNFSSEKRTFHNSGFRNSVDGKYEAHPDSSLALTIKFSGQTNTKESQYRFDNKNYSAKTSLQNAEERMLTLSGNSNYLITNIVITKKPRKPRRYIHFSLSQAYKDETSRGFLLSDQAYYSPGMLTHEITDQYKTNRYHTLNINSTLNYTEPISPSSLLTLSVEYSAANSKSNLETFNKSSAGQYKLKDYLFSNNVIYNANLLKAGLSYFFRYNKHFFIAGLGLGQIEYRQKSFTASEYFGKKYLNLFPSFYGNYQFASRKFISLKYDAIIKNPTINEVQANRVNLDPINIFIGNPNLKPAISNNFRLFYFSGNAVKSRDINLTLNYTSTDNKIGFKTTIDTAGRRFFQYINTDGNRGLSQVISYNYKLQAPHMYLSLNTTTSQNRYVAFTSDQRYIINSFEKDVRISVSKSKENRYECFLEIAAVTSVSKFKIPKKGKIFYASYSVSPSLDVFLPYKFRLHSDINVNYYPKNLLLEKNTTIPIWNASVEKMLLKSNALQLKLFVNDILDKNQGISSENNATYNSQTFYTVIKRYGLLSMTWNFNKFRTPKTSS